MASQDLSPTMPSHSGLASVCCLFTRRSTDLHKDMQGGLNAQVIGDTLRHNTHKHREFAGTHSACLYKCAALVMIAEIYTTLTLHLGFLPLPTKNKNKKQSPREGPVYK